MKELIDIAKRRRTNKKYDENKKISQEDLDYIMQVTNSAPTSMGLQAWRIINLKSQEQRKKYIDGINIFNQDSYLKASDIFVYITKKSNWFNKKNEELISVLRDMTFKIIKHLNDSDEIDEKNFQERLSYIQNGDHGNNGDLTEWSKRQAYIVMAFTLLAATELNIETTPVEGFNKKLEEMMLKDGIINEDESVTLITFLGYSSSEKKYISKEQLRVDWKSKITNL